MRRLALLGLLQAGGLGVARRGLLIQERLILSVVVRGAGVERGDLLVDLVGRRRVRRTACLLGLRLRRELRLGLLVGGLGLLQARRLLRAALLRARALRGVVGGQRPAAAG